MFEQRKRLTWRSLPTLVAGILAGTILIQPAVAHIGSVAHLWNEHLKPKVQNQINTDNLEREGIRAGFLDSNVPIPGSNASITSMTVPGGKWAIFAKFDLTDDQESFGIATTCILSAGGDFDRADVRIDNGNQFTASVTVPMEVTHDFGTAGGNVDLSCNDGFLGGVDDFMSDLKIIAIRQPNLQNIDLD